MGNGDQGSRRDREGRGRDRPASVPSEPVGGGRTGRSDRHEDGLDASRAWALLSLVDGLTPRSCQELLEAEGGPVGAVHRLLRGAEDLPAVPSLPRWLRRVERVVRTVERAGARQLTPEDPGYPRLLLEINDPPPALYCRGGVPGRPAVAIVGARDCTRYGRRIARRLAADLARAGIVIVSGLARGIDGVAHRGALEGGGKTVAVLPCGIDRVYPRRHRGLAGRIARDGALVTEYPPETEVAPWHFPVRNRIIAGLAEITVVVEAAEKSGTTHTVNMALDYGRQVLAVPGPLTSATSAGPNGLLARNGPACRDWQDVIRQLPGEVAKAAKHRYASTLGSDVAAEELSATERRCFEAIPEQGARDVEELVAITGLDVSALLAVLTGLELRGLVRSCGVHAYERNVAELDPDETDSGP